VKGAPGGGIKPSRPINETYLPQAEADSAPFWVLRKRLPSPTGGARKVARLRARLAREQICHSSMGGWMGVRKYAYNIGNTLVLGIFEQAVLLAVRRLGNEAYGRAPLL